jgi:hypothetical protein
MIEDCHPTPPVRTSAWLVSPRVTGSFRLGMMGLGGFCSA